MSEEIKPVSLVNPRGNQFWIVTGRTDAEAEAEAPILWPTDAESRLTGKNPDWGQEKERVTEGNRGWDG